MNFIYLLYTFLIFNVVIVQVSSGIRSLEIGAERETGKYDLSKGDLVNYSAFILSELSLDFETIQIFLIDAVKISFKDKYDFVSFFMNSIQPYISLRTS